MAVLDGEGDLDGGGVFEGELDGIVGVLEADELEDTDGVGEAVGIVLAYTAMFAPKPADPYVAR
jgi:hypothetical protein